MTAAEYIMARIAFVERQTGITPNIIDVPSLFYKELCDELGARGHHPHVGCMINGVRVIEGYNRPHDS